MNLHRFSTYISEDIDISVKTPDFGWNTDIKDYFKNARDKFNAVIENDMMLHLSNQVSNLFQEKGFEVSKVDLESDRFFMLVTKKMHYVLEVMITGKIKLHFIENYSQDPDFLKDITWFNNHKQAIMDDLKDALDSILETEKNDTVYINNGAHSVRLKMKDFENRNTFAQAMINYYSKEPKTMTVFNPVWINGKKEKFTYIDGNHYFE